VISCPCALSLSVPAALAATHGALARIGVLAVRPDALERLARVTDVVFDKTGTLSDGVPVLEAMETFHGFAEADALRIAAALERDCGHPLAAAFGARTDTIACAVADVATSAGAGVRGRVDGIAWRLGHARYAADRDDDDGIWLGDGASAVARFQMQEAPRADAIATVASLQSLGLRVHLCSGDAPAPVARLAAHVGIELASARQTPESKLASVRQLQHNGRVVAMVGDGLNDAPVLAGADVSIAMGSGAPLAHRAADFVLTGSALLRIPQAIALAHRSQRIIAQNLAWAVAYNLLAVPLAVAGLVTPWMAALGMALSSLTVTANALRLTRPLP